MSAMVGHCPKDAGMFKAQVKVPGGSGAYAAAIYEKGMGGRAGGRHR